MTKTKRQFRRPCYETASTFATYPRGDGRNAGWQLRDRESLGKRIDGTCGSGSPSVA